MFLCVYFVERPETEKRPRRNDLQGLLVVTVATGPLGARGGGPLGNRNVSFRVAVWWLYVGTCDLNSVGWEVECDNFTEEL
jgi:hypothetical protein